MKKPSLLAVMRFCLCLCLLLLPSTAPAAETVEGVEQDLAALLKEMDAVSSELDRIEDLISTPKATFLRLEVHRDGAVPAPAVTRLVVQGRTEDERDVSKAEREAFAGAAPTPVVVLIPFLPGDYPARVELLHPSWKSPAAADFRLTVARGETLTVRFRLSVPPGKTEPALLPMTGK